MKRSRGPQKTWGPCVIQSEGSDELKVKCSSGRFYCLFHVGNTCTDQKPPRTIDNPQETPDWCKHKASALWDAQAIISKERR